MSDEAKTTASEDLDVRNRLYAVYPKHLARRGRSSSAAASSIQPLSHPWLPRQRTARVLELGCGSGEMLRQFRASGFTELTGVDRTQFLIESALAYRDGINYVAADAKGFLGAHGGRYDLVCAFDFIEHLTVDEALEVCDLVHRALEPGGSFVLRTPNASSLCASYGWHSDLTHMTQYTEYSLFQLLDAAGFEGHTIVPRQGPRPRLRAVWHPMTALDVRSRVNVLLHRAVYWARAQKPPASFEHNLEVWTFKP